MITVVQSKTIFGTTVALDSSSVVGHGILVALSYRTLSQDPVNPVSLTNAILYTHWVNFNFTVDSLDGYGLHFFWLDVTANDIVSLSWDTQGGVLRDLITIIVEFSENPLFNYDTQYDPVALFPLARLGNLCLLCSSSYEDSCIITFPTGTTIDSVNGAGALGVAYRVAEEGLGTISSETTSAETLYIGTRMALVEDSLMIRCGVLHPRPGPE